MSRSPVCPGCGGADFEQGFVDDMQQGKVRWVPGAFERGILGAAKGRYTRPKHPVIALRCTGCSRLELYAGPPL